MVNKEFHIIVTAKANARKIIVMMHVRKRELMVTQKRAKELLKYVYSKVRVRRQENKVKECGLKTVNEVRAPNFLAGSPKFLATPPNKN